MSSLKKLWLVLLVTRDCNLRCTYCYADGGKEKVSMDQSLAKHVITAFLEKFPKIEELEITFFGGEPTLKPDFIRQVVDFSKSLSVPTEFSIATNGIGSDNIFEFMVSEKFEIGLSMDSIPVISDLTRGVGTSKMLQKRISQLSTKDSNFHIRATITNGNISYFAKAIKWWADKGVDLIHFELVNNTVGRENISIREIPLINIERHIGQAIEIAEKEGVYLIHSSWMNFKTKSKYYCGMSKEGAYIILPDGNISSCFGVQSTDINPQLTDNFIIGRFCNETGFNWQDEHKRKLCANISASLACKNCSARTICGGGCLLRRIVDTKNIHTPHKSYCDRKRLLVNICDKYLRAGYESILCKERR